MCDNCAIEQDKEIEITDEQIAEMLGSLQSQQKEQELIFFRDPIEFDEEEMTMLTNTKEFIEGQSLGAKLAGLYSTLVNFGFEMNSAMEVVMNQQTIEHNLEVQNISKDMNVDMAKFQSIQVEKNQL